jgi:acyl dehydratase
MAIYFEDLQVGATDTFGRCEVTREDVIAFAEKFDPQPFHLSDEAAAKTYFKRISASGWHTAAMTMSMLIRQVQAEEFKAAGSPGVEDMRFLKPVYPGDVLTCERTILEKRRSEKRKGMGVFVEAICAYNQHGEKVLSWQASVFILARGE